MVLPTAIAALFRKLFVIFADDTNIFCSELDAVQLCIIIIVGNELDNLAVWFVVNKIIFIVDKTNFMAFGNSMQIYTTVQASIDDNNMCRWTLSLTGMIILTLKETKLPKNVSVKKRVNHVLTSSALYSLYCTLVMPYLTYCCEVWGNSYKTRIQSLFILQKRAIIICLNTNYK